MYNQTRKVGFGANRLTAQTVRENVRTTIYPFGNFKLSLATSDELTNGYSVHSILPVSITLLME